MKENTPAGTSPPKPRRTIEVFTDGSARPNPGKGSFGYKILEKEIVLAIAKGDMGEELVSNNHMELLAVITALRILKTMCDPAADSVYLYTDSMYVQQGITMWINAWKKRNWKTSAGTPVVNKELWEELEKLKNEYYNLHFAWVRGHNGNIHNEHIDQFIKSE